MKNLFTPFGSGRARALAGVLLLSALSLTGFRASAQISGTKTVCASGCDYTSLTNAGGAFAAINSAGTGGAVTLDIQGNLTAEAGTNALAGAGTHAVTITSSTASQKVITFTVTTGSNNQGGLRVSRPNVIIDGVVTGVASADAANKRLSFRRSVNAPVIGTAGDAADNLTIQNCDISPNNNQNVFSFGNGCTVDGADNFILKNNTIHPTGTNRANNNLVLVATSTPATIRHDNGLVEGNSFYNWGQTAGSSTVISLVSASGWTVKGNHFFGTNTVSPTGNRTWTVIQVPNANSGGHTIEGNFIGGSDINCGGSNKFLTTASSDGFVRLMVFRMEAPNTEALTTVKNNRVTNFDMQLRWAGNCTEGIMDWWITNGNYNIEGNEFGTGGEIIIRRTSSAAVTSTRLRSQPGVSFATNGNLTFRNNKWENWTFRTGHTLSGDFGQIDAEMVAIGDGLSAVNGNVVVEGNLINNINFEHTGTISDYIHHFRGIKLNLGNGGTGSVMVRNNTVSNVTIRPSMLTRTVAPTGGCTGGQTFNAFVYGIEIGSGAAGPTGGVTVHSNKVFGLNSTLAGTPIDGIKVTGLSTTATNVQIYNNAVSLGEGTAGATDAVFSALNISPATASSESYYINNNTFAVGGSVSSGSSNTAAVRLSATAPSVNMRNNIVQNLRTGGSGNHYAYVVNSATLNTNNNMVFTNTKVGNVSSVDYNDFATWTSIPQDNVGSQFVKAEFTDAENGNLALINCSAITGVSTSVSSPYASVTVDITGATQSSPPDPGAYKHGGGGGGGGGTLTWLGAVSSAWTDPANWCGGGVPSATTDVVISDASPRAHWPIISSPAAVKNMTISGSSAALTINTGLTLTINGNFSFSGNPANFDCLNGSIISISGTGAQTINNLNARNVTLANGTKTFTGTNTVSNILNLGSNDLVLGASSTLALSGTINATTGKIFGEPTSDLSLVGNSSGTITLADGQTLRDILISTTGGVTLSASTTTNNLRNITVTSGTFSGGAATVFVSGNMTVNGGTFNAGTGRIAFNGAAAQTITGTLTFNDFSVEKITNTGVTLAPGSSMTVNGTFELQQDNTGLGVETSLNVSGANLTLNGPVVNGGPGTESVIASSTTNLVLNGASVWPWSVWNLNNPSALNNFTLNTSGSAGSLNAGLTINGTANFTAGTLNTGAFTVNMEGIVNGSAGFLNPTLGTINFNGNSNINHLPVASGSNAAGINMYRLNKTINYSGNLSTRDLHIEGTSTLNITGDLALNATVASTGRKGEGALSVSGTTSFTGTNAATVSGTNNFNTVNISNSGTVTFDAASVTSVGGTITLGSQGKMTNNGSFTLRHNATERASIAALTNNCAVNGNITVEQYVSTATPGWYFLGGITKGNAVMDLMTEMNYRGVPGAPTFYGTGNPTIFFHNEANNTAGGWTKAATQTASLRRPHRIYLDANFFSARQSKFKTTGPIMVGDSANQTFTTGETYPFTLTRTPANTYAGFNLVHNPYPSNILLDNTSNWTLTNVSPTFHFWDGVAMTYTTVNRTSATKVIPMGQAFFVQATGASPVLRLAEAAKTATAASIMRVPAPAQAINITIGDANTRWKDYAKVVFDNTASVAYDDQQDADNLNGGVYDVFTLADGHNLTDNLMALPQTNETIGIGYAAPFNAGAMVNLTLNGVSQLNDYNVVLVDNYTGSMTNVTEGMVYSFMHTGISGQTITDRFVLMLQPKFVTNLVSAVKPGMLVMPNPAASGAEVKVQFSNMMGNTADITITDAAGRVVATEAVGSTASVYTLNTALKGGVYTIRCVSGGSSLTQKLVVQ